MLRPRLQNLKSGDEILVTAMEHHANIVPWQMAAERTGAKLVAAGMLGDGSLDMDRTNDLIQEKGIPGGFLMPGFYGQHGFC